MITKKKKKEKKAQVIVTTVCVERSFDKSFSLQYFFFFKSAYKCATRQTFSFFSVKEPVCVCVHTSTCVLQVNRCLIYP